MRMRKKNETSRRRKRKNIDIINDNDDLIMQLIGQMRSAAEVGGPRCVCVCVCVCGGGRGPGWGAEGGCASLCGRISLDGDGLELSDNVMRAI